MKTLSKKPIPSILSSPIASRLKPLSLLPAATALLALPFGYSARAATVSWTGASGGDWNTSGNWSSVPGASDTALFNTTLASVVNASADQSVGSISFDTNAGTASGSFTVGTTGGNKLILGNAGTVQILSSLAGTGENITVNAPLVLTPASSTTAGSYTFSNNSGDSTNTLNFGGAITSATTSNTETLTLSGSNTGNNTISGAINNGQAGTFALTKSGLGTWVLTGSNSYTGQTQVQGGTLVVGSGGYVSGSNGSTIVDVGVSTGNVATLTVKGTGKVSPTGGQIVVGDASGATGTLNVQDTASVTSKGYMVLGNNSGAIGTLNLTSGTVSVSGVTVVANSGNGYANQTGGVVSTGDALRLAYYSNATGIYTITGGTASFAYGLTEGNGSGATGAAYVSGSGGLTCGADFQLANAAGSYGLVDVSGGSFSMGPSITNRVMGVGISGTGVVNVRGGVVTFYNPNYATPGIQLGINAGASGQVNLLSGTLNVYGVTTGTSASVGTSLFNFNGGTLQARSSTASFMSGLTKAMVFSGGAVIDTQAYNVTVAQPLLAASGTGVASIPVNASGSGYLAAPVVQITGGSGSGATAIATVNSGTISGIVVTNPGTGYSPSDTLTFTLVGGNPTSAATLGTPTWAANSSGGLTKLGTGALALTASNTYTGTTTVTTGTVQVGLNSTGSVGAITSGPVGSGTLALNGGAISSNSTTPHTLLNPVTFTGNAGLGDATNTGKLTFSANADLGAGIRTLTVASAAEFDGVLSNTGGLTKAGAGTLTLAGSNTYAGTTTVTAGALQVGVDSAGSVGAITSGPVGTGTLALNGGALSSNSTTAHTLFNPVTFGGNVTLGDSTNTGKLTFGANADLGTGAYTLTTLSDVAFLGSLTDTANMVKAGAGTMTLTGSSSYSGQTQVTAGKLVVDSGGNIAKTTLFYVGMNNGDNGTLTVKGSGLVTTSDQIIVGNNNGSIGTFNVQDAANVTGGSHIQLGYNGGAVGVLNLTSGTVAVSAGLFVGNFGSGYINQTGGVLKSLGGYYWHVGNNAGSFGSYSISGGSATQSFDTQIGYSGVGALYVSGSGSFSGGSGIGVGSQANSLGVADVSGGSLNVTWGGVQLTIGNSGTGVLNVRGGLVANTGGNASNTLAIGSQVGSAGTVNLISGTVSVMGVVGGSGASTFNFNGGTLQARSGTSSFVSGLTNAYVYSGGAVIDSQGYNIAIAQPLLAASGTGVVTIPVSASGSGYLSAPIVKITGGSGSGATAIATISSGTISGITITNPGTGYSPSDTLTFTLVGGNPASAATLGTPTWAANTSGGLTKVGTGTLSLAGTNTYTGATTVNAGTLKVDFTGFGATPSNAINPASTLVLNGGAFSVLGASTSATSSQTFNGLNVNSGISSIAVNANSGGGTVLNLGGIARNLGGTVDFSLPAGIQSGSNGIVTSSGAIGGWATVSGTDWATLSGSNIVAVSSAGGYINDVWASGSNTTVTASSAPASGSVTNSLRFAAAGANTVTLSGTNTLTSGGILVTGSVGNNLSSIAGGILQGAAGQDLVVIQNNTSNGLTISSAIQNNGSATGLTKTGGGTLALTGSNSYSGSTILVAGTLQVGNNSALGSGTVVLNAGTVSSDGATARTLLNPVVFGADMPLGNAVNNGALTFSGNVNMGGATRTLTVNSAVTLGGAVSNGGITKTGAGMLTLSGSNSYTGATTVSAGILAAASANSLPNYNVAGKVTVASSGTLALGYGGPNDWTSGQVDGLLAGAALASGAGLAFDTTNLSGTYGSNIANAVSLTKLGANTLTLAGSNSYTGVTNINGGTLNVAAANALPGAGNIVFGGGTLQYSGANQTDYSGRFANSGTTISIDTNGQTVTFGSNIVSSNTGGLSKSGSGTLVLTGSSAYTGVTTVNSGTLQVGNGTSGALPGASTVTVNGGGTLAVNIANSGTFANPISMYVYSNPVATVSAVGSGTNTLSGNIAGTVYTTFNQSGSGLTILTGNNTYFGPTNITNGALMLGQQYAASGSPINVGVSNGLLFGANTISIGGLGGGGNVALVNGTNAVALTSSNSYFDTTYSGSLSGSNGTLIKSGVGMLTLTGSSSYSGYTQVSAGKLVVDSGGNIAKTTLFYVGLNNGDNGTLTVKGTGLVTTSDQIIVGSNNGSVGTFNVQDTANVTGGNHIQLGANGGAVGVLNLTSGTVAVSSGFFVGNSGIGYMNQSGGVMKALGGYYWHVGNNPGSFGSYSISGGSATQNFDTQIGYSGVGALYVSGSGSLSGGSGIGVGSQANSLGLADVSGGSLNVTWGGVQLTIGNSGTGVLNVRGGLVANTGGNASNTLSIGSQAGSAGTVNLISGTVSVMGVVGGSGASAFNFNGGTLQARSGTSSFVSGLTNAYVYSGGAVIDSQGYNITVPQSLLAASGTGVASIPVSASGSGYLAAPIVQITGGSGSGATAIATISSGTISGITITNPGTGYSPSDTLTFTLIGGNPASAAVLGTPIWQTNTSGGLTKLGAGSLTLTSANTYTGATSINAGTLQLGDGTSGHDGSIASASVVNQGTLNYNLFGNQTYAGAISGSGALGKSGSGTLILAGSNTYSGPTTVSTGTLQIGNGGTSGSLATSGITDNSALLFNLGASGTAAANYAISGTGTVTKNGSGTVVLSASNSYTGATTSNAGILQVNAGGVIPGSQRMVINGGTLLVSGGVVNQPNLGFWIWSGANITLTGGTISGAGGQYFDGLGTWNQTGGVASYGGNVYLGYGSNQQMIIGGGTFSESTGTLSLGNNAASATLTINNANGGGTVTVPTLQFQGASSGTNTVNLNGGTLNVSNGINYSGSGGAVMNFNGGTFHAGGSFTPDASIRTVVKSGGAMFDTGTNTLTLNGALADGGGGGGLTKIGSGMLILRGSNSYTGATSVNAGTLQLGDGTDGYDGSIASASVVNQGTLNYNLFGNQTYAGAISGSGALGKSGAGILTFTGSSSYSGTTAVHAGGMVVDSGGFITKSSLLDVGQNNGDVGTLTVKGTGQVTTGSNSQITIGDNNGAIGTLNVQDAAQVTSASHIFLGNNGGSVGVLKLTSGTVSVSSGFFVGNSGNGYMNQSGGVMKSLGGYYWHVGNNPGSFGSYNISGGSASQNFDTQIGYSGAGALYVSGSGSFSEGGGIAVGSQANSLGLVDVSGGSLNVTWGSYQLTLGNSGTGVLNVRGGLVANTGGNASNTLTIGSQAGSAGTVNLISGTVSVMGVVGGSGASTFNFNGGALQARGTSSAFMSGLSQATVYSGGAVIDSQGFNIAIAQPLLAASGTGVASIPLSASGSGYLAAPIVQITGGSGSGATAIATISSGTISGITITNPGTGYSPSDTLTFTLVGGNPASSAVLGTPTWQTNTSGGLTKSGAGSLTLTSANTYTGATSINAGTLQLGDGTDGHDGSIASASVVNQGTLNYNLIGNQTYAGTISGSGSLGKSGGGTLILAGSNSYSGATSINAGTLQLGDGTDGHDGSIASASVVNQGTLNYNLIGNQTYAGAISGSGSLGKSGAGTLILAGSNSYSGGTVVSGGTLQVGNVNALGSGGLTVNNGTLDLNNTSVTAPVLGGSAGLITNSVSGTATLATATSGTSVYNGAIADGAGSVVLTNSGAGTVILGGALSIAGLNVAAGTTQLTQSGSVGAVNVASGATLSMAAHSGSTYNVLNVSSLAISGFTSALSAANNAAVESAGYTLVAIAGQKNAGVLTDSGLAVAQAAGDPAPAEAVPEPGTLGMLLAGALGMLGLRRQRRNG